MQYPSLEMDELSQKKAEICILIHSLEMRFLMWKGNWKEMVMLYFSDV